MRCIGLELVYLDTCVWCRPFDVPSVRITKEADAMRKLLVLADLGEIEIISSSVCLFEASLIENVEKRVAVSNLIRKSASYFQDLDRKVEELAVRLMGECNLDDMDSVHIAISIMSSADTFLTTDDELISRNKCISELGVNVKNPLEFVEAY